MKHSDSVAYAEAHVWPGEINELMNSNLPEDEAETIAGLFIDCLGEVPEKNQSIKVADIIITVLEKEDNRLIRLKLEKISDES